MGWEHWPFHPRSLTEMIGPRDQIKDPERFISLLVSGWCELLQRPLTVLEPDTDSIIDAGAVLPDAFPLRRIDHINPYEHFTDFCAYLRANISNQEIACQEFDKSIARSIMTKAVDEPDSLIEYANGYPCRAGLIDQVGIIRFGDRPVAVAFSGQFLPDKNNALHQTRGFINGLYIGRYISQKQKNELLSRAKRLVTADQHFGPQDSSSSRPLERKQPSQAAKVPESSSATNFLGVLREIEQVANAEFHLHKRRLEVDFKESLRSEFPLNPGSSRESIAVESRPLLDEVRRFCAVDYLALFVSPQRYVSYEENLNLLTLLVTSGIDEDILRGIDHFNWRKAWRNYQAGRSEADEALKSEFSGNNGVSTPTTNLFVRTSDISDLLDGLKGEKADFFYKTSVLFSISLSEEYRAVLLWGPFSHLGASEVETEREFLYETSELVLLRVIGLIQLLDSLHRTETFEEVAGLLSHYSSRVMAPVSTGARIVSSHLAGYGVYSREDALKAADSLTTAAKFITQTVRVPLSSFAAMAENVYEFSYHELASIVGDCVALYQPLALEKKLTIDIGSNISNLPNVEVDRAKFADAVGYIMDNAVKYSHSGRTIRVYGKREDSLVCLTFENYGQGIDEDELGRVFARKYQGRRSHKALYEEGEGMGLYHARLIVEAHKGRITCGCHSGKRSSTSSRLEGYLVWFTIEIPMSQSAPSDWGK